MDLPSEFDLVIVGTGVVESIISAAASRVGKQVLHLDNNEYYGGPWASFNFEAIQNIKNPTVVNTALNTDAIALAEEEKVLPLGNNKFNLKNVKQEFFVQKKEEVRNSEDKSTKAEGDICEVPDNDVQKIEENKEETKKISQESLLNESRKFNIDLSPKLHYARGDFVELLISSNIARYSEFRSCSRVLTWINNQLEIVPCSRSDVFSNDRVTVIEKRMLMKLLTVCMDESDKEFEGYEQKTFKAFLEDRKLTDNLVHYVLYAIAMCDDKTLCLKGVENTKRFVNSLGRFGKTPFLYSMYGSGEIPQAFCRLSAVFGGVYALHQSNLGVVLDNENKCSGVVCGTQKISAKHLVLGLDKMPQQYVETVNTENYISRAVFLIDKSIVESDKEHLTLLLMPHENDSNSCVILEMGTLTGTCPKDMFLVHMITKQVKSPEEDFAGCVKKLFASSEGDNLPNVLWCIYFSIPDTNDCDLKSGMPENVFCCPGPNQDLDYDSSIEKARAIFIGMYPDAEFLPRAPDPEEIIIGEEPPEPNIN